VCIGAVPILSGTIIAASIRKLSKEHRKGNVTSYLKWGTKIIKQEEGKGHTNPLYLKKTTTHL